LGLNHADPFVDAFALTMKERPQQTLIKYRIYVVTNEKGKLIGNPNLHQDNMKRSRMSAPILALTV